MSKAEILAELPKLSARDREEILAHLCRLDEAAGPSEQEKNLLDEAQSAYTANPDLAIPAWHAKLLAEDQALYRANPTEGSSWSEVKARITSQT